MPTKQMDEQHALPGMSTLLLMSHCSKIGHGPVLLLHKESMHSIIGLEPVHRTSGDSTG